jgi:hypothetical protein
MAKAKKETKGQPRNRTNLLKNLKRIEANDKALKAHRENL